MESIIPSTLLKPCRQIKENRLDNFSFITSFRRSHRIPLFHEDHKLICPCKQKVDIYGDHFFSCLRHNKIKMHHHIRNTIHFITSTLGPHANFIPTKEECKREAENLLPSYPSIRPGDVTLHTGTHPFEHQLNFKAPITAIDCTMIGPQNKCHSHPTCLKEATNNRLKHHLHNEMKKYDRPTQYIGSTQVSGEAIIKELNQQNITLLPFTFDAYGSMGPLAMSYFYKDIYVPTITDEKIRKKLPTPKLKAYLRGRQNNKMISLFDYANKGWRLTHKDKWFGSTYQLTAPSNWGKHYLGMNINIALTQHLKRSFIVMDKSINVKAKNKKNILY